MQHLEPDLNKPSFEDIPVIWEVMPPSFKKETSLAELESRELLIDITDDVEISDNTCLELIVTLDESGYNPQDEQELETLLLVYNININSVSAPERNRLLILINGANHTRTESTKQELTHLAEKRINEVLTNIALNQIDNFSNLLSDTNLTVITAEHALRAIMESLQTLSKNLPTDTDFDIWQKIYNKFKNVISRKKESRQEIRFLMSRILNEYSDFIDDEFIAREVARSKQRGGVVSIEHLVHDIYDRNKDEIEDIKKQNRKNAVEAMQQMSEIPYIDTRMLLELYGINNKGIAPKFLSRLRENPEENIRFGGKRLGIMPEDVAVEMKAWDSRVADMIDKSIVENWSDTRYQIAVAELHNELLEIHPFPDRNGSTSVMFMELMMMRRGYKPSEKREKNYYKNIASILKHNPVALSLIGHEMYRMTSKSGYFPGKTTKGKERLYDIGLKHIGV